MLPEIFRLLWWVLIKRKTAVKARKPKTAKKTAAKKTAATPRRTAHKKTAPAPRSGAAHKPKKAASPRPATTAAYA
jgi:hypothetical protein